MDAVVALDYGGTAIKGGVVSASGELLFFDETPTGSTEFEQVADGLFARFESLRDSAESEGYDVLACAIGSPGIMSPDRTTIYTSPNFPSWKDVALCEALRARGLDLPVFMENDANVAALGEYWQGAGRGAKCLILLTLGTGIGGALVLNGELFVGAHGMGAELGHITVDPRGPRCGCGNYGCMEALASATAVVREFKEAVEGGESSSLKVSAGMGAKEIAEAAYGGDELAARVFSKAGGYLGVGLASIINVFDPDVIVLGGGMSASFDLLRDSMWYEIKARALARMVEQVEVVPAQLGNRAGVLGAAHLAFGKLAGVRGG